MFRKIVLLFSNKIAENLLQYFMYVISICYKQLIYRKIWVKVQNTKIILNFRFYSSSVFLKYRLAPNKNDQKYGVGLWHF